MSGGRLGDLDAYVPVATGEAAGSASSTAGLVWLKDQYREALDRARREGKLVFVNFTGYACANCHWMKANMFTRPEIAAALQDFVLVDLYGDGTDAASEDNQKLELAKFNTVAEPFYAILDPDEKVIATFPGLDQGSRGISGVRTEGRCAAAASPSPTLSFTALDGKAIDLAGKVAVVNFWATWCVPCIREIPSFNKLHRDFAAKGVSVVGVSMDEDGAASVKPFLEKHPIEYPVGLGNEALAKELKFNIEDGLPVTVVFDRKGKEVKRFEGFLSEPDLLAAVQAAL